MRKKFVNLNTLEKESKTNQTNENELTPFAGHRMKLTEITIAETEDWIALNKPSGLLSIPDREGKDISLKKLLIEKYARPDDPVGRGNIFTVHRLDKDTSGLIVFAKNETTHKLLSQQFEERQTEKIYYLLNFFQKLIKVFSFICMEDIVTSFIYSMQFKI